MIGQRRWYFGAALAYVVVIAVVSAGLLGLYRASRERLDEALGERLLGVASTLSVMVDSDQVFNYTIGDSTAAIYLEILSADFISLSRQGDLAEISLCDTDGKVLASSSPSLSLGQINSFWDLDSASVGQALTGSKATSPLYKLQSTYQKSAHAPVIQDDLYGGRFVVGVLTVSGSPDFFDALSKLKMAALMTASLVVALLVLMGLLLHRINLALQRSRQSLQKQESLAAMGRMTAGIAHEIRNPLGIIRGAGQHLQRVLKNAGIADEVADFIPDEVDRLDGILGGYLEFGGKTGTTPEVLDMGVVARRSVAHLEDSLQDNAISLDLDLPEGIRVLGNSGRLQQVLLNLILNSRDAMKDGGRIEVVLSPKDGLARLQILDQGVGLEVSDSDKLFEPFFTTKEKGSGLGLATCRQIVEEWGGTISLNNRPDRSGAIAEITLPVVPVMEG